MLSNTELNATTIAKQARDQFDRYLEKVNSLLALGYEIEIETTRVVSMKSPRAPRKIEVVYCQITKTIDILPDENI